MSLVGERPLIVSAGLCIAAGAIVGSAIMKKIVANSSTDKLPTKWVRVGEIKELIIYPVKGMPGIPVNEAALGRLGLKAPSSKHFRDRVFVIADASGKCYSQTKFPMLALAQPKIDGNQLHLSYAKDPSFDIVIDIPSLGGQERVAIIYGERVMGLDCGDKVASWLSRVTETPGLRLLYHATEEPQRGSVKRNSRFHTFRETHTGAFQDETSYLLASDESLAFLNKEISKPISHSNFRPTIVVNKIVEPFAEDFWGFVRFGDSAGGPVMKTSLPCQRCKMTTVDPETGTFRTDGEPLRTLYRLKRPVGDEKVTKLVSKAAIFGAHFGVFSGEGDIVRVGDPVHAALL